MMRRSGDTADRCAEGAPLAGLNNTLDAPIARGLPFARKNIPLGGVSRKANVPASSASEPLSVVIIVREVISSHADQLPDVFISSRSARCAMSPATASAPGTTANRGPNAPNCSALIVFGKTASAGFWNYWHTFFTWSGEKPPAQNASAPSSKAP